MLSEGAVCQGCMIKFNEYDQYLTKATQLKDELINQFRSTQDSKDIAEYHSDLQLIEAFPETELEIDLSSELDKKNCAKDEDFGCEEIAFNEEKTPSTEIYLPSKRLLTSELFCDFCAVTGFVNRQSFITHLKAHRKSEFYCETCQLSFKAANSLKIHISSGHGAITKNIPCTFSGCHKSFANKNSLRAHFVCHNKLNKIPSHVCDTCGN